jgi:hypothetical protein
VEKTHKIGMASSVYGVKENHDTETLARPVGEGFKPSSRAQPGSHMHYRRSDDTNNDARLITDVTGTLTASANDAVKVRCCVDDR